MKEGQPIPQQEPKTEFELAIEKVVGESIETIRQTPVDEMRRKIEAKFGAPIKVTSEWPFIGRKESQKTISKKEINREVDKATG